MWVRSSVLDGNDKIMLFLKKKKTIKKKQRTNGPVNAHLRPEIYTNKKVQVGKDQEKAQSEKDSHSKNRGGKKPN